jgi:hypothetical protein
MALRATTAWYTAASEWLIWGTRTCEGDESKNRESVGTIWFRKCAKHRCSSVVTAREARLGPPGEMSDGHQLGQGIDVDKERLPYIP